MSSLIEHDLYGNAGTHGVLEFSISPGMLQIWVAPWEGPNVRKLATFRDVRMTSVDAYADGAEDLEMPWDIIGFDCKKLSPGRWGFCLHCDCIEWSFESAWPNIERYEA